MAFHSLQHRIVVVFVGLLLLVMTLVLLLVRHSDERIVAAEMERGLDAGSVVFTRLVEHNSAALESAAALLAADFGFREAIATLDRPTMRSVLRNHGLRIGAEVMMVMEPAGPVIAETQRRGDPHRFPFPDLFDKARAEGSSVGYQFMNDGRLYHMVLVPVLAPKLIAWVAMGFPVDDRWAATLSQMTGLTVSVIRREAGQTMVLASSLEEEQRVALAAALAAMPDGKVLTFNRERYQTRLLPLGSTAVVALQRSLDAAEAPFRSMQIALLVMALAGIAVFAAGSVLFARHIASPVNQLTAAARRIAAGDYDEPLPTLAPDEIGALARSFEHMRDGIATRERKILKLAYEDALTGLPNRTWFLETFATLPPDAPAAIAVLDIDRFALINNALGHPVGDRLLAEVGARLARVVTAPALVARLWGDEFAFLLRDADQATARAFAETLLAALHAPISLDDQRVDVEGSLGIALFPADGRDATTLLRRAELAMSRAKCTHAGYAFAAEVNGEPPHEQLSLIGEMRAALAGQEFVIHYQPKLHLPSGRIVGVEALLRWQHPQRGLVAPANFIPFAEQTGFIREITPWLLERVAEQTALWHGRGLSLVASVNLSAHDLLNPQLPEHMRLLLGAHALPPDSLCLEITESALMEDPDLALHHLSQLAALGLKLSIDDYGAGQASLAYLKLLPVHEIKIDRSFISCVTVSPKDAAIVQSTIQLGHALGLSVVAEGTEHAADLAWLRQRGCDIAQGYGIARPMPAQDLPAWLGKYTPDIPAANPPRLLRT
ncbi:MAG: GGDEF domain-containing protein [Gammaproteobacteria bacterium HGW-Gammaproteobacteria-1]|jgi:diguanylate cyclase (GGDEF)-like protein|nr:MAG: GGDEF domain-containing protein [Gammaproteobacteria bacterium HGW-Gammaproteobacteria-1]